MCSGESTTEIPFDVLHIHFSRNHNLSPTQAGLLGDHLAAFLASKTSYKINLSWFHNRQRTGPVTLCFPSASDAWEQSSLLMSCFFSVFSFAALGMSIRKDTCLKLRRLFSNSFLATEALGAGLRVLMKQPFWRKNDFIGKLLSSFISNYS